ncbi:MAG: ATP-binding protein [Verrucomicrobia bacterium]|nr:ATP-binding protein [Verrucomicrobiota bacterium]
MSVTLDSEAYSLDPIQEHLRGQIYHVAEAFGRWQIVKMVAAFKHACIYSHSRYLRDRRRPKWSNIALRLEDDIWVAIDSKYYEAGHGHVRVYARTHDAAHQRLLQLCEQYGARPRREKPAFFMLTKSKSERSYFATTSVWIRSQWLSDNEQLALHYGDEFPQWAADLEQRLCKKATGLFLLRGEPGTGKTYFLRHLIWRLRRTHRTFYIPNAHFDLLSSPSMTRYWLQQQEEHPRHKVLVILEDAENLVMRRGQDNRAEVANLLNLADGLLGECVRAQLICTVNCPIDQLDAAVTRRGRLLAHHEFRRLTRAEGMALARHKGIRVPPQEDYSLAEIYAGQSATTGIDAPRAIGFQPLVESKAA